MGLFDKLKKATEVILEEGKILKDNINANKKNTGEGEASPRVINAGFYDFKEAIPVEVVLYPQKVKTVISLNLSADFKRTVYLGVYEQSWAFVPGFDNDEVYEMNGDELNDYPLIFFATVNKDPLIYNAVEAFENGAEADNISELTPINRGNTLFKAKGTVNAVDEGYSCGYFYVFDLSCVDPSYSRSVFGVIYPKNIINKGIEKKLISEVDKAFESLKIN